MRRMNEWFKPEKLTTYYFAIEAILLAVALGIVGLLAATGILSAVESWVLLAGGVPLVVAFAFLTWWIPAFYRSADYRLADDELEYRRGVFFQQKTTVPYNRITNVNAARGPLQRLVGAGSVGIHTAGYGGQMGAELTIDGVGDYEEIKDQVLGKVRQREPLATEGEETAEKPRARTDPESDSQALLAEIQAIRQLLEQGRSV
ncbi:PH domain-containing protein [Halogeometricum luteum]|uniref:PH domain-containing protein n=1 Tax=Halogeometricum luteum TaxID=2950537 RepID=A0ABU2G527_9EURY|nr:PH domain-containing protein [Halogeometricum sp. S3BR5-2]MDS0295329.1 PH domain-containing protein [Halogeometricum sp. S3BR5-2]